MFKKIINKFKNKILKQIVAFLKKKLPALFRFFDKVKFMYLDIKKRFIKWQHKRIKLKFNIEGDFKLQGRSIAILLYRFSVALFFILIITVFRENYFHWLEEFFNLFRIKKIFRLDTFNSFLLLKITNFFIITAISLIIMHFTFYALKWHGTKLVLSKKEVIFEERSFLSTKTERVPITSITNFTLKAGTIEEIFGIGNMTIYTNSPDGKVEINGIKKIGAVSKELLDGIQSDKVK